jgi:glycosyltransferase involved in cell wall biosynthesis
VKRRIEALDLGGIVGIAGYCEDMPAAYMLSDAVVAVGAGRGFSRTLVEAQAMGRPVICDSEGGAAEGMLVGETGWTASTGKAADLAQALDRALDLTADQRAVLSRRAQQHVRRHFALETMCGRMLALYEGLTTPGTDPQDVTRA